MVSICSGAFVLAAAGVLDGKRATTHWRYAERLARRYPALTVEPNALYVDEGQVLTSAGSAAGLDMLLHLVRTDYGPKVANLVAQRLVIPPHREGGQAQFVPRPLPRGDAGRLAKLMDWIRAHPAYPHSVESMAKRSAMSPRTLHRQFHDATGLSPYDWIVRERVAIAKEMLETSQAAVSRIADQAGFGSEESFRRHFRRVAGVSPAAYRRQFSRRLPKQNRTTR
jgi:AraC family transcriptional activator FtrA